MIVLLSIVTTAHAEHKKVFLLAGQSNMEGGGDASELSAALTNQPDVLLYNNESETLGPLVPRSNGNFGPEITFGRTIADALPSDGFALIKHAQTSTNLYDQWDPQAGGAYSGFSSTVADGLQALTDAGHTYEIVGMLWTQGERDARHNRTEAQYEADLIEFIDAIRTTYGTDLPFFLSRLSSKQTDLPAASLAAIRSAQTDVAASDPYAYLIDTDGFSMGSDDLHFDAAGQIALGQAFGQAYLATVPEPSSLVLLGLGGLALLRRRRMQATV